MFCWNNRTDDVERKNKLDESMENDSRKNFSCFLLARAEPKRAHAQNDDEHNDDDDGHGDDDDGHDDDDDGYDDDDDGHDYDDV